MTSPAGSEPAALQWTLTYPAANVVSISASAGSRLTAAGKGLSCAAASGTYTCVAWGMNATTISNGTIAVVNLTMAAGVTTTPIGTNNTIASSPAGAAIPVSATGGTVTGGAALVVTADSVTPASGTGTSGTFQFVVSDNAGYADIAAMEVVISNGFSGSGACYFRYDRGGNRLWLVNDAGTQFTGPVTLGVAGTLSNSQCSLNVGSSTVASSGVSVTLTVGITFTAGFSGSKNVYVLAVSASGQTSQYQQRGTWNVAQGVPTAVSTNPSSGTGTNGTFQFVVSDSAGYNDLAAVEVVISNGFSGSGACYFRYDQGGGRLWLVSDAGTQFTGPATLGVAGTLSNSQCSLNVGSTTAVGSGTNLTLAVPITFTAGFAGSKNIYMLAISAAGQTSGYQQRGTWTVPGVASVPSAVSVTPSSGSSTNGTFQFVVSDSAGYTDLAAMEVVISNGFSGSGACYFRYDRGGSRLSLVNDAGTQFTAPATPGVAGTLSNSQCSLNVGSTTVVGSGNNLTLAVPITFTAGFAGSKNIYMLAISAAGQTSGYQQRGTWTVPSAAVPSAVSVTPSSGNGSSGTFQFVVSDSVGYTDLGAMEVVISNGFSGSGSCYFRYDRTVSRLWLVNDAGTQLMGPATPGVAGTLSNSQCSLNVGSTTVVGSGNNLTLAVPITFVPAFAGTKNIYMLAVSAAGQTSGYQQRGTWTVPGVTGVPSAVSVTPSSGSGANGTFQFVVSDSAGYTDLAALEIVISSGFSGSGACYFRYDRTVSRLWLVNNAGTQLMGPATPGVAGTLSNSQCSLNVGTTTVVGSGNNLTLTVPITFVPAFAGTKNIYMLAVSAAGQTSGYQQRGTWTAQ